MDKKYISPFVVISLEGISGLIIVSVLIPIMSMVQCNSSFFICKGTFSESFKIIFENMFESSTITWLMIYMVFVLIFFNVFRLLTNQQFSSLHRSFTNTFYSFILLFFSFLRILFLVRKNILM